MKRQQFILIDQQRRDNAIAAIAGAKDGLLVTIADIDRTKQQNATLHMWFGEIARQGGGRTLLDVKGQCHHKYALSIRMADPIFLWIWQRTGEGLSYEKQCAFLASEAVKVSSAMNVSELNGYMNDMSRDYRAEGFLLTDPEAKKYEALQ